MHTDESPPTKQKLDKPPHYHDSRVEKIAEILKSVGARKGSSSKANLSMLSSIEAASSSVLPIYDLAKFRKINTEWYRETHDSIWERLRNESESLNPNEAVQLVDSMKSLEAYRRRCGSRILCLDGGGIRGLLQMAVLSEIERQTKKRIVDQFDWIVGTSTGGIIALALTYGAYKEPLMY